MISPKTAIWHCHGIASPAPRSFDLEMNSMVDVEQIPYRGKNVHQDTVRPTTCVCAAASMSNTRIIPWMLDPCQLIKFLQVIRVMLWHGEK
jgi:hypothetical protein